MFSYRLFPYGPIQQAIIHQLSLVATNLAHLVESDEETVDVVSGVVWVQCLLMLVDLLYNKLPKFVDVSEDVLVGATHVSHQPGEDVVQLGE